MQDLTREAERLGLRSRGGKRLHGSGIHAILRDPLYRGYIRFDGAVAKGRHEPIVEDKLWFRAQAMLGQRRSGTVRPKDRELRDLFVFGDLLKCSGCGRTLCPYRAKRRYIYYECKNRETQCHVIIPQPELVEQLPAVLAGIRLDREELDGLRSQLIARHREMVGEETGRRRAVSAEYEQVMREIGEVFAQRKEAEALGVLDAVDLRLAELRGKKDELQARLNACHEEGDAWVEKALQCFRLIELLQEAIFYGSREPREQVLRAVVSNFTLDGRKLVPKLKTPFRERSRKGGHPEWWATLYDVRTEIAQTADLLQKAFEAVAQAQLLAAAQV